MVQSNLSNREWQQSREADSDMEESISSADQSRSPVSLASETETPVLEDTNHHGTPIHHPRFTNHREKLGNDSNNGSIVRPIPIHATLEKDLDMAASNQETSSNSDNDVRSRPKRELSSDKLNILSYKKSPPSTATTTATGSTPAKRIRFMSFDEILTTAKQSDSHYVSPSFALESAEELDLQLGEELKSTALDEKTESSTIGGHSFTNPTNTTALSITTSPPLSPVCVPLLTPPQSPRQSIEVVEWPSNLVVESALMNITDARPLSPASLTGEEDAKMETIGDKGCTLTKRLSFITVGSN
jgi:hypothetical protein